MNLIKILYEPYVIIIFISLLITTITYFITNYINKDKDDEQKYNISKILLYTFIVSFLILMILKYFLSYMNNNKFFQKGGETNTSDKLTIIADDIDCNLLDN